jgi:hypothetical protein
MKAEQAAGIEHEDYRALHGGRRYVVGEIGELTGDLMSGLEYVGDRDPKMLTKYNKRRAKRIAQAAAMLDAKGGA